jgi:hypothetical protein
LEKNPVYIFGWKILKNPLNVEKNPEWRKSGVNIWMENSEKSVLYGEKSGILGKAFGIDTFN